MNNSSFLMHKLTAELKKDKFIKGILLFGSYARDPSSNHNDIDFYLISARETKRSIFLHQDETIDVFYNTPLEIRKRFLDDLWLTTIGFFLEGKIVYDPEKILKNLINEAHSVFRSRRIPSVKEVNRFKYLINDTITDIAKETDEMQALYLINSSLPLLLKIHYRMTSRIPPKDNYIIKELEQSNRDIHSLATRITFFQGLLIKKKLIKDLAQEILKPVGGLNETSLEF